jgi:hypothetical protein
VELIGIEPTASRVRWQNEGPAINDFAELERQQTSENAQKRPILATSSQNSVSRDPVAERLADLCRAWTAEQEPRKLRKGLLEILGMLE